MTTHDLVAGRLVARDAVAAIGDQLLDQLGARGLVLDQHYVRTEQALLLAHRALERRVFEPPAEHTEEEEVLAFHAPGRAHREIAELGRLVGGVPALHDAVEALRPVLLAVALEPFRLDQAATLKSDLTSAVLNAFDTDDSPRLRDGRTEPAKARSARWA